MPIPLSPFVKADSLFGSLRVLVVKFADGTGIMTGVTGVATTDILTKTAHGKLTGDSMTLTAATSGTGLVVGTTYFVIKIDANTFKLAATYADAIATTPVAINFTVDYVGAAFLDTLIFEANKLDDNIDQSTFDFTRSDTAGVRRKVRTVLVTQQEAFVFTFDQAKRLPAMFAGGLVGRRDITCTMYKADPMDASGFVSLKSETDFPATLMTEGSVTNGDGQGTLPTLRIESNKQGVITWTRDAAV